MPPGVLQHSDLWQGCSVHTVRLKSCACPAASSLAGCPTHPKDRRAQGTPTCCNPLYCHVYCLCLYLLLAARAHAQLYNAYIFINTRSLSSHALPCLCPVQVIDVQQVDVWVKVFGGYAKEQDVINNVSPGVGTSMRYNLV
jgi:hypothetical protein